MGKMNLTDKDESEIRTGNLGKIGPTGGGEVLSEMKTSHQGSPSLTHIDGR
jgi:hypothetical protein